MARRTALMLVALQCASAFVAPQRSHLAAPRRRVAVAADNRVEDQKWIPMGDLRDLDACTPELEAFHGIVADRLWAALDTP